MTFHHGQDCCFVIRASRGKNVVAEFLGDDDLAIATGGAGASSRSTLSTNGEGRQSQGGDATDADKPKERDFARCLASIRMALRRASDPGSAGRSVPSGCGRHYVRRPVGPDLQPHWLQPIWCATRGRIHRLCRGSRFPVYIAPDDPTRDSRRLCISDRAMKARAFTCPVIARASLLLGCYAASAASAGNGVAQGNGETEQHYSSREQCDPACTSCGDAII